MMWKILLLVSLLIVGFAGQSSLFHLFSSFYERHEIVQERDSLKAENQDLKERIESLKNDPKEWERRAREEHGMKRENEEVIIFRDQDAEKNH